MSPKKRKHGSLPRVRIKRPTPDSDVGYGRPPQAHQFKPGQTGNPNGRPKGVKNEATILHELLYRKIPVRVGGRTRMITVLEAIHLRFTEDSLRGNTKSAAFLLNRFGTVTSGEPQQFDISDDDREVLEAFARRFEAQRAVNEKTP